LKAWKKPMNKIIQGIATAAQGAITTDDAGTLERRYCFTDSFAGFAGHFPEHPILPAIVEILTVISLVGEQTGRRQRLVAVDDAKFLNPVRPNQELLVRCRQRTVKGKLLYDAQLTVGDTTTATLLIELADAGELP
jgi:3-hydroxyacyl-[acyl-carrier-protein] dehydratase